MITKAYLRKKFVYRNGNLYRRGGDLRKKIGCHIKSERYVKVKIDSKNYYLHRKQLIYYLLLQNLLFLLDLINFGNFLQHDLEQYL